MATLSDIIAFIRRAIQDTSITDDLIIETINNGQNFLASSLLLPALETQGTFVTNPASNSVIVPSNWNYGRNLYSASYGTTKILVFPSLAHIIRKYNINPEEVTQGEIMFITLVQNKLRYYNTPAEATTVTCRFYSQPKPLKYATDIPVCIDRAEYQMNLLSTYALWHMWSLKEDGMEGLKVNTEYYKKQFYENLSLFEDSNNVGLSRPELDRTTSWI